MKLRRRDRTKIDGAKLNEARLAAELSLLDVAKYIGCNQSSVSRWELGKLNPSTERVLRLVVLLKSSDFVVGEES